MFDIPQLSHRTCVSTAANATWPVLILAIKPSSSIHKRIELTLTMIVPDVRYVCQFVQLSTALRE